MRWSLYTEGVDLETCRFVKELNKAGSSCPLGCVIARCGYRSCVVGRWVPGKICGLGMGGCPRLSEFGPEGDALPWN